MNPLAPSRPETPSPVAVAASQSGTTARRQDFRHPHAHVLGVRVSALDLKGAVDLADRWLTSEAGYRYVCVSGVHGVMEAHRDMALCRVLNGAFLNLPDGMPMSWVGRTQGYHTMDRVFGPEFMAEMCRISVSRGYRHFLYGGEPGIAQQLGDNLRRRFPGLLVVGTFTPPFRNLTSAEESELLSRVHTAQPHILWVGLSTPKQECFMAQYVEAFQVPLLVGVGAAFDYHTGRIHDCASWIKRMGLQWLHRLAQDPRRLTGRYLRNNPAFLWHIAGQLAGLRPPPRVLDPERHSSGGSGDLHAPSRATTTRN